MVIRSVYLDTSVFGGYFDEQFSADTIPFFERLHDEKITLIRSEMLENELAEAPGFVKDILNNIPQEQTRYVTVTGEVEALAEEYIKEKVVGETSFADCTHIALATVNKADILASWNFRHIVNIDRIKGYNSVNMKLGYPTLEIRTPKEINKYD